MRISVLPSLFLVWDSKTGSLSRIGDRADHAFAHVVAVELLVAVFVDGLEQALAEGAQVRAAVGGVLAVDEGIKSLAVAAVAVGEAELERFLRVMERGIDRLAAVGLQVFHHQVEQAVAGLEGLAVVDAASGRC